VLHDADASLACWLARVLPAGTKVRFDAPDPGWVAQPPDPPFVDVFLYDVREDDKASQAGWSEDRDADGRVTRRQQPPRRYKLRYLLTAWAADPAAAEAVPTAAGLDGGTPSCGDGTAVTGGTMARAGRAVAASDGDGTAVAGSRTMAEHDLLGALLSACVTTDVLSAGCLRGTLASAGLPVLLRCAPAGEQAAPARLWAGFGLPPRTFLDLLLIVPVLPPPDSDLAPPAREIALGVTKSGAGGNGSAEDPRIAGDAAEPRSMQGAAGPHGQPRRARTPVRHWERSTITEHITRPPSSAPMPHSALHPGFAGRPSDTEPDTTTRLRPGQPTAPPGRGR